MNDNRQWMLTSRPIGNDFNSALKLTVGPIPSLTDGDVLIRNGYLSMDAGTRMWMNPREDSYQAPTPVGSQVQGMVIGEVVSSRHSAFRSGDLVRAYGQWADYSVAKPNETYVAGLSWAKADLHDYLAVSGPNGWTAYLGITEYGEAAAGETVVVSAAAGATGLLAGQVAKASGCRVIGIAGTDEKCSWLESEFKFDATINYRAKSVAAELKSLCPTGVDLYFDNVGGPLLDDVLTNMSQFGRVAISGLIANYHQDGPVPGPYKFDLVLMRRLKIIGFFSPDFYHREESINRKTSALREAGKLRMHFEEVVGLENTVEAYGRLFAGTNKGKVLVKLADLQGRRGQ